MKKIVRLTENDLMRIVKRVISEQSNPSNTILLDFERLMELNQFKLIKFGSQDFKEIPTVAKSSNIAKNIVVKNTKIPGLQLYRGIPEFRAFKDEFVYIWLDGRDLTTEPFAHLAHGSDYKRIKLSSQLNELKSYIDTKIVKNY